MATAGDSRTHGHRGTAPTPAASTPERSPSATEAERRAEREMRVLASRQDALRDQLRQERAASREPAQPREPERPFERHRDRGMELGR